MSKNEIYDKYNLYIKTISGKDVKNAITHLKTINDEVSFLVTKTGITAGVLDKGNTIYAKLNLCANRFEEFVFNSEKPIELNFSLEDLCIRLTGITKNEILIISQEKDKTNSVQIEIIDKDKSVNLSSEVGFIELDKKKYTDLKKTLSMFPKITTTISSSDFSKMCKSHEGNGKAQEIEITSSPTEFRLFFPKLKKTVRYKVNKNGIKIERDDNFTLPFVRGVYNLKLLVKIIKSTNLSTLIQIYMSQEKKMPLTIKFQVSNLGSLIFYLMKKKTEREIDEDKSDEEIDEEDLDDLEV